MGRKASLGGYAGQHLYVDMTKEQCKAVPIDRQFAITYLGGQGFASRILYDKVGPQTDPLSPENVLIWATGPFTGTLWPQASRYVVAAKSPLTGIFGEAHAAGHWGPELKFAGFDTIIITGRAKRPLYLFVDNGTAKLLDAKDLWGHNTNETEEMIKESHYDPSLRVSCIGQAGENLVRFAAIINDYDRAAARSGIGAVAGSKHLKAVAVRGSQDISVAKPDRYLEVIEELHKKMLDSPFTASRAQYGTTNLVELMQEIGRLPSYNMRSGVFAEYQKISGEAIKNHYLVKPRADYACLQRCGRYTLVRTGPYAYCGGSPEYESQSALGSRCGNDNLESILYGHHLSNLYGLDTISTGSTISWAMEAWEEGLITAEDTGGIDLEWGNHESIIKLIHMIAHRKGFGDILAEGSYRAAQRIGRGTEKFVMHCKKQEIAGQEPRAQKSMGLATATAARGADHLYAFPVLDEVGFDEEIGIRYGQEYLPEMGDRLNPKFKGIMVKENEDFCAVVESLGVCKYGTLIPPVLFYEDIVTTFEVTVGLHLTEVQFRQIGERIVNLNRGFNVREGIRRKDDSLPRRLTHIPAPEGPSKGQVVELDQMLDEYYEQRGWQLETGLPKIQTLHRLGLDDVIEDLRKQKIKLPQ
ncbi:MAG: aldehyde ferredoxin oxidoreductase family protein [Candidatus Odinarchaeota archaeon]